MSENELPALPPTSFGEPEADDFIFPFLLVKQKQATYDEGDAGDLIISNSGEKEPIFPQETKVPFIPLRVVKGWQTQPPYESDDYPEKAYTKEDAAAMEAAQNEKPEGDRFPVIHFADIEGLLQHTEESSIQDEDEIALHFPYQFDGKNYAVVKFTSRKQGYDATFKRMNNFSAANPGVDHATREWLLQSQKASKGRFSWFIPALQATRNETGPEALAFIARTRGGAA